MTHYTRIRAGRTSLDRGELGQGDYPETIDATQRRIDLHDHVAMEPGLTIDGGDHVDLKTLIGYLDGLCCGP